MIVVHDVVDGLVDFRRGHRNLVLDGFVKLKPFRFELLEDLSADFLQCIG